MKSTYKLLNYVVGIMFALGIFSCNATVPSEEIADYFILSDRISSEQVTAFAEDGYNYIWIATKRGLNRFNGKEFYQYFSREDSLGIQSDRVNCLLADDLNNLWIGTTHGISCYRYEQGIRQVADGFITHLANTSGEDIIYGNIFGIWRVNKATLEVKPCYTFPKPDYSNCFVTDIYNKLWIFEDCRVQCMDLITGDIDTQLPLDGKVVSTLLLGNLIYVATDKGISIVNIASQEWDEPELSRTLLNGLEGDEVVKLYAYSGNSFFIYTRQGRLYYYNAVAKELIKSCDSKFPFKVPDFEISTLFVDSHSNIWIGAKEQGYTAVFNRQEMFNRNYRLTSFFSGRSITSLYTDRQGELWIVSEHKDLYCFNADGELNHILLPSDCSVEQVFMDKQNRLWVVAADKVLCGKIVDEHFAVIENYGILPINGMMDDIGNVWISSVDGSVYCKPDGSNRFELSNVFGSNGRTNIGKFMNMSSGYLAALDIDKGFYVLNLQTKDTQLYDLTSYCDKRVMFTDFTEDANGNIWVSSLGNGLFEVNLKNDSINHYEDSQYCHDVCSVKEDALGYIWLGTFEGLTRLDPKAEIFTTYYREDGIADNEFTLRCVTATPNKRLIFGGAHGMTSISPDDILPPPALELYLEYLIHNDKVMQNLMFCKELHLPYNNSGVNISYTTLNYGGAQPLCQYKMEGLDLDWNMPKGINSAYYSHLPVGDYTFKVKVGNGIHGEIMKSISVTVHPSLWGTPLMLWLVYPLLIALVLGVIGIVIFRFYHNRMRMNKVLKEKEQEKRANELNMKFFSNISHEFRTPLTLIHGALSMLPSQSGNKRLYRIICHNTERLLRLVNQLMDFNKLENGMLKLSVCQTDVCELLQSIVGLFEATLSQRKMRYELFLPPKPVITWLDRDKFEKILVNLIANAIKYSNEAGSLSIRLNTENRDGSNWLRVDVADTGIGVPEDKQEEIFKRFYQLEKMGQTPSIGTGVGLYYTRCLVELHHGQIHCRSNHPCGSIFSFTLPMDEHYYTNDQKQNDAPYFVDLNEEKTDVDTTESISSLAEGGSLKESSILLVDDDTEVLDFLQLMLEPYYLVHKFSSVTEAYVKVEEISPDLIISDVIMHEIDGYQFCKMVKSNAAICHIPVILLTAKASLEEQIEGLDCGASVYVTKPFSPQYLLAVIRSQLDNVKRLQQILANSTKVQTSDKTLQLQQADNEFMQTLYKFMEEHLSEPELPINILLSDLNMGRSKFFYKVKALTGDTPNLFFRTYKLNRAAEMILSGNEKFSYIADITGFSSPSHFSTSFKKHFNCLPSEYKAIHS